MSPSDYLTQIVLPTVDEHLAATGNLRRAILACVVTYHVRDYLDRAGFCSKTEGDRRIRALCAFCAFSFDVVEGVCNGSKHFRNTERGDFKFTPGDEKPIPVFEFDLSGLGFDESRLDIPGLEVEHQGQRLFIDFCLCAVLGALGRAFPAEFSGVDLEGYGKRVPGYDLAKSSGGTMRRSWTMSTLAGAVVAAVLSSPFRRTRWLPEESESEWSNLEAAKQRMVACLKHFPSSHDGVEKDMEVEIRRDTASCGKDYLAMWQQQGATWEQSMASAELTAYEALGCRYANPTEEDLKNTPGGMRMVTCSSGPP